MPDPSQLSKRQRQIMDVIYARGRATAAEVRAGLAEPPSPTAVRTLLRILEDKGVLRHERAGRRHLYLPTCPKNRAARSAVRRVLEVFFENSLERAVAAHLADPSAQVSAEELTRLEELIRQARAKGD